jgi:D-tyrosyl-tRNA(Tyr) deacylase
MRTVVQRVKHASVIIQGAEQRRIGPGLLVLLGIEQGDTVDDINWLCGKIARLRIFADTEDKMNLSVMDTGGELMVISQFTLHASTRKGNRPSWIRAADPEQAKPLYADFIDVLEQITGKQIVTGEFAAHMDIELINDGPVTIIIDTKLKE